MSTFSLHRAPDWMADALCSQVGGDVFYPAPGASLRPAKRVCARCEVRPECLAYALQRVEVYGVWGGTSESERRLMRRNRLAARC